MLVHGHTRDGIGRESTQTYSHGLRLERFTPFAGAKQKARLLLETGLLGIVESLAVESFSRLELCPVVLNLPGGDHGVAGSVPACAHADPKRRKPPSRPRRGVWRL